MRLAGLFYECAFRGDYQNVGLDVNYKFVEDDKERTLYIYFQGSSSIFDWVRNFMFGKRPYKDMRIPYKVHRGFLNAWKEVEDIVIDKVKEIEYSTDEAGDMWAYYKWKRIVVVGYSHGGALAAFCHECVWFHRPDLRDNCGLVGYGFEAPRIFAQFHVPDDLKKRWETFTVIRTNNDIVTHCPPVIFKYRHVGNKLKVTADTSIVKNKLPRCVKSHYPEVVYNAVHDYDIGRQVSKEIR